MKRPAFQFYPADWRKDAALQSCSVAAQGLWINILCIAHECDPYGHMTVNGKPMTAAQIGRLVGLSAKECATYLQELEDAGVSSVGADGSIFSRRMVRDEQIREARAEVGRQNGMKGKEFGAMGAQHGAKGGRPKKDETPDANPAEPPPKEPGQKPPQNPLSSSSSSSSASALIQPSFEGLPPAEPPPCPQQRLLGLFAELLPELPQPRRELWEGSKGSDAMRQRWKWVMTARRDNGERYAETAAEGIEWMSKFFGRVAESDFLTGRNGRWKNCDLTWLMGKENFAKVVQGNYAKESS